MLVRIIVSVVIGIGASLGLAFIFKSKYPNETFTIVDYILFGIWFAVFAVASFLTSLNRFPVKDGESDDSKDPNYGGRNEDYHGHTIDESLRRESPHGRDW